MSRRGSILQYSRSDRSASRLNRTPSTVNKNASASHQLEPDQIHDYYTPRVESTFPHQEDHVRLNAHEAFGFQDLLATQGVPFNNASCGREIRIILRTNFKGPWHSWDKVDELLKEFKQSSASESLLVDALSPTVKKYAFPGEDEAIVRKIWEDKARISLNQQLARARNKAMSIIKTKNIIDCLDKGPVWIQNEDWNTMINDVWSTDGFHKRSKSSKQNRLKKTDGKISTHSAGSVSFASYRASMQEQAGGKELPWDEVFSALHQKANDTGTFVYNRSKIVVEKYRNEMITRYGPDEDNHPSFDGAAWCEASGGVSKGRVYGAPRMLKSKVNVSSSSHTYSVHSSYPSTALEGHMGLSMPTPMAPSMPSPMAPSMPSHTMAPMGPVSSPVYRHRPRPQPQPQPQLPYNGPSSSHPQHHRSFSP
uniref:Uncharacterized protein n=1 Tax=Salix viminalis TaxID=40686 RepID=A0A6N2KI17_SALVM